MEIELQPMGKTKVLVSLKDAIERENRKTGVLEDIQQLQKTSSLLSDEHVQKLLDRIIADLSYLVSSGLRVDDEADLLVEALGSILTPATVFSSTSNNLAVLYLDAFKAILVNGSMTEDMSEQLSLGLVGAATSSSSFFLYNSMLPKEKEITRLLDEAIADPFCDYPNKKMLARMKQHFADAMEMISEYS